MKVTARDLKKNILKSIRFERPDFIPMKFVINPACWQNYPQDRLFDLMEEHPFLFPDFVRPKGKYVPVFHPVARKGIPYKDDFGCVWETSEDGITGTVTGHPLSNWKDFDGYIPPDPNRCMGIGPIDWKEQEESIKRRRAQGEFISAGLRHGHTFLQLSDIRGYSNLIFDMADDEPRLYKLMDLVEEFNTHIIKRYLDIGVDMVTYAEDLGMEKGPMVSPEHFVRYIKPVYTRMMKLAKDRDVIVHMHSDGDLRDIIDHMLEGGIRVINLQDLVNGVDWIAHRFSGKICVELDVDRAKITPFGTPAQIDALIREEVEKIGSPQGGLMFIFGLYPGTPLENVKALMDAMERYAFFYS